MIYLSNKKFPNKHYSLQKDLLGKEFLIEQQILNVKIQYIGRPQILGNPFSHLNGTLAKYKCETREESIYKFGEYFERLDEKSKEKQLIKSLRKLSQQENISLQCWCCPLDCHGRILMKYLQS